jgi:hypothetical protein
MPRKARLVCPKRRTHYVVSNRLAGETHTGVLSEPRARAEFEKNLWHFASIYTVRILCCSIGSTGFRMELEVDPQQRLSHAELERRQGRLDHRDRTPLTRKQARKLRRRLGSLSEFMRDVQGVWSRQYNRRTGRRGPMWAERFHSVMLGGWEAIGAAAIFVRRRGDPLATQPAEGEAASGWHRSWRREEMESLDRLWLRRHWRELVPVWEWGRAVGDRRFVERCARRDHGRCRWEVAELGIRGLWSLRPPVRNRSRARGQVAA